MIVVIDASAGFELLTDSESSQIIRDKVEKAELVIAPDLYVSELTNICWKAFKRKEFSINEAVAGLRLSLSIIDLIKPLSTLAVEALKEAAISGHSAYDLMYLVLARREAATLVSVDKGMLSLARKMGIDVID